MGAANEQPDGALRGVRVLDLATNGAGARAAAILAEYGAEVVKVIGADPRLALPATLPDWLVQNRSKRIATGDTGPGPDLESIGRLVSTADVVVVDTVDQLADIGLIAEQVAADHVILAVPAYLGSGAPWHGGAGSNDLLDAITGVSRYQGSSDGRPVSSVYPYITQIQAVWAATAAVAALVPFQRNRAGQTITVSGLQAAMVFADIVYSRPLDEPEPDRAVGAAGSNPMYTRYQGSDGQWVFLGGLGPKFSNLVLDVVGLRDLLLDARIDGKIERLWSPANSRWVIPAFADRFRQRPAADWVRRLEDADIPCTLLGRREDWFTSEQMTVMNQRVSVEDPLLGDVWMTGAIIDSPSFSTTVTAPSAPVSVVDTDWRSPRRDQPRPNPTKAPCKGPLEGVTAAVMGSYVAGPFVGRLLAELGADVIKVEPPSGDPWRAQGFGINRGTRSIVLDLRLERGRDALRRLFDGCDIVVNNFRLGVTERLEIGHADLVRTNPDVVTVSVTAYGERGPLALKPGYDPVLQAASGMLYAQGGPDEPVVYSLPPNDCTTAVCGALAAVLGIYQARTTGAGSHLSTALGTTALYLQAADLVEYRDRPSGRSGGEDFPGPSAGDRYYRVADGWIRLQAPDLDPDSLEKAGLDLDTDLYEVNRQEALERSFATLHRDTVIRRLNEAGIPAVPSRCIVEVANDPTLFDAGILAGFTTGRGEQFAVTGHFATFSATPMTAELHAPGLGEHSSRLLSEAGLAEETIAALIQSGAVKQGQAMDVTYVPPYR